MGHRRRLSEHHRRLVVAALLGMLGPVLAVLGIAATHARAATTTTPGTQIGVMITPPPKGVGKIAEAKRLGAGVVRPLAIRLRGDDPAKDARDSVAAGLKVVVTYVDRTAGVQTQPPSDFTGFRARLASALTRVHPELVVIENEEQAAKFYSGTAAQYLAQLRVAVRTAHARQGPVTDGGIVSPAVQIATWDDLWRHGHRAQADRFVRESIARGRPRFRRLAAALPDSAHPDRDWKAASPEVATLLTTTRELLAGYRASAMDYVNLHWYQGSGWAFGRAVRFLQRVTAKSAVTNEIGQFDRSPATMTSLVREAFTLEMPYVVWFAADGGGGAQGLVDADGTIRPNGVAFRSLALRLSGYGG